MWVPSTPGGLIPRAGKKERGMLDLPWLAVELREWFASTRSTFLSSLPSTLITDPSWDSSLHLSSFVSLMSCDWAFPRKYIKDLLIITLPSKNAQWKSFAGKSSMWEAWILLCLPFPLTVSLSSRSLRYAAGERWDRELASPASISEAYYCNRLKIKKNNLLQPLHCLPSQSIICFRALVTRLFHIKSHNRLS